MAGSIIGGARIPSVVALIPARGGSVRVPGKNLRGLAGRSLVERAIDIALAARRFERVVVTTDDPAIMSAAVSAGALVLERPAELAGPTIVLNEVVLHAMDCLLEAGLSADGICLMTPTAATRSTADVVHAVDRWRAEPTSFVGTVVEYEHHPYYAMSMTPSGYAELHFRSNAFDCDRSALPRLYRPVAVARIAPWQAMLEQRTTVGTPFVPIVLPDEHGIDVDSPLDLELAGIVLEQRSELK